ncbi:hypothetical protein L1049_001678 [Liquidambar formosana]|uniref:Uncharacterized protein n=1 Tax=Liquidambar formosana TaxID=63359 RepID=A0AAP0R2L4_LIQFO
MFLGYQHDDSPRAVLPCNSYMLAVSLIIGFFYIQLCLTCDSHNLIVPLFLLTLCTWGRLVKMKSSKNTSVQMGTISPLFSLSISSFNTDIQPVIIQIFDQFSPHFFYLVATELSGRFFEYMG